MRWLRKEPPTYVCEVCESPGVERRDIWDYCPRGHIYVGERAAQPSPASPDTEGGADRG